ncbi:MAG: hypothetical protein JSU58_01900 [Dehalococcoidales bacterium]|nr:MAG: hypothetical protein JSU58_01900 [Dehalococcoidales bacterium]
MSNSIQVTATPSSLVVKAGESVEANLTLHNSGQTIDQLTISVEGLDAGWYTLPVSSVALFPNDEDNLKIVLEPPKTDKISAGSYTFHIKVNSQADPEGTATVDMSIEIQTVPELEISISPQNITGRRGIYQIEVNNPGDSTSRLHLQTSDTHGSLRYHLQPEYFVIPAKDRMQATLEVSLGWLSFFGGDKVFSFQVLAIMPEDEEGKNVEGQLTRAAWYRMIQQIRLPRIQLPRILTSLLQKPPEIITFVAKSDDRIDFKLNWSVKRSKEVKLDDEAVGSLGERVVSPAAPSSYVLTATNRYGDVRKEIEVEPRSVPEARSSERIRASLSSSDLSCQAGGIPEVVTVQMQNLGETVDKFIVKLEGVDEAWYSRSASSVALMPQASEQVQISFNPPKKRGVKAKVYPFAVTIRSQNAPDEVTIVTGQVQVLPLVEYKLKVAPYRISCRRKGTFRVGLSNTGTSDARIALEATDLDEGLKFKFKKNELVLSAWDTIELPVKVKPKKGGFVGERKRYDITITTNESSGNSQTVNCELHYNPFIGSWKTVFRAVRTIIFIGIIGVLIGFVIHWGGGFGQLRSSPGTWWNQLVNFIVDTFGGWFSN